MATTLDKPSDESLVEGHLAPLRYARDTVVQAAREGILTGDALRAVAGRDLVLEWRKVLSCVEFMVKEDRLQQALEARPFLRSRLVAIDAAREAAGEDVDAAMACHRIHDKEGEDMVLCDCCARVAEVFVREGQDAAAARAAVFLEAAQSRLVLCASPASVVPPPLFLEGPLDVAEAAKAARAAAVAETLHAQAQGLANMLENLRS